jgi:hypothetical protein
MIMPSKHVSPTRSLLGVGAEILAQLERPEEVSDLWEKFRAARSGRERNDPVSFDWFVAALTFLYTVGAIHSADSVIVRGGGDY